jgi:hypothetical protein
MIKFLQQILDWSEAWATLLPITVFLIKKPKQKYLMPVIVYLVIALLLNTFIDLSWKFYLEAPTYLPENNNFLYNIHSVCRLFLVLWFFSRLHLQPLRIRNVFVAFSCAVVIVLNFTFFESFRNFSDNLFSFEGMLLLICCLSYLLSLIKSDYIDATFNPALLVVTGIAVYEAVSFSIFLFHEALTSQNPDFSVAIWKVHNYVFIVMCLFFAKAFYGERKLSLSLS